MTDTPCEEWPGSRTDKGYGQDFRGGRNRGAHRMVIKDVGHDQFGTPWSDDLIVMHLCDNPPCVRYDHLKLGTYEDNMRDAAAKGRMQQKLTADQIAEIRRRRAEGELLRVLAAEYGVRFQTIHYHTRKRNNN